MRTILRILIVIGTITLFIFKKKFMKKMGLDNERVYWLRMLTYSLAGMTILFVRTPLFHLVGITEKTPLWIKTLAYIPLISTTYMVGFVIFGTILGQGEFVRGKLKKRFSFISKMFKNVKK